jgi:hypothetical protein
LFGQREARAKLNPALAPEYLPPGKKSKSPTKESGLYINSQDNYDNNEMFKNDIDTLKMDKNCLQCSGNASHLVQSFKIACLGYTQSPINYNSKQYMVSELLRIKAQVISQN